MDLTVFSPRSSPALPPEAVARDLLSFAAWGKGLTQEQYIERERRLWRTPFAQGLRLWILGHEPLAPEHLEDLLARRYLRPLPSPLTLLASAAQIGWHVERGRFYGEITGQDGPAPIGVRAGEAFGLWAHDPVRSVLRVLMLYPG